MDPAIKELLKPEILSSLNGLELTARVIVEGFMSGANRSQTIGFGQEFSQYRNYEPGDDLRQLDWRMYARSERYYIKQSQIETNITVKFMLDASRSMAYEENGISKVQFARLIMAALGYLAQKQGDTFGLYSVNERKVKVIHPRFEHQHFIRFLYELTQTNAEGKWRRDGLEQLYHHSGKEMIIFISDLYDQGGDILQFVSALKTSRNEVIVLHIMGKNEVTLKQEGVFSFQDLESGKTIRVDTKIEREAYTQRVGKWLRETKTKLIEKEIFYSFVSLTEPLDKVLRDFLRVRETMKR